MIFVVVGTQGSFDRLVMTVDDWARERARDDVFAQIGDGEWTPRYIQWTRYLSPVEFQRRFEDAAAIVSHAGMGTIITALRLGKPILVMPRSGKMGEHRNDHQLATAGAFQSLGYVQAAQNEQDLHRMLDSLESFSVEKTVGPYASEDLLRGITRFIDA
jgi:UDP-N-acetylglucosamine transferase subunit ALG13